jgi:hypothetical protein
VCRYVQANRSKREQRVWSPMHGPNILPSAHAGGLHGQSARLGAVDRASMRVFADAISAEPSGTIAPLAQWHRRSDGVKRLGNVVQRRLYAGRARGSGD